MRESGRIIAGTARGIRLVAPGSVTRALTDRVKESLFGSLESEGALVGSFLDLFAGSGAAGIEALSRGAREAVFVERDPRAAASIEENLRRAHLDCGRVVRSDVMGFLRSGMADHDTFAAVLLDPPYDQPLVAPSLELLGDPDLGWLSEQGVVVAKHFWRDQPAERVESLMLTRQKRFGETMLSFYTRKRRSDHGGQP